jgi:serine/threonine protein phosphatase 1
MFTDYRGKTLVVGHTVTKLLPPELWSHTPAAPKDLWAGENVIAIDTGCGEGGFLTAVDLPGRVVYESRSSRPVPMRMTGGGNAAIQSKIAGA